MFKLWNRLENQFRSPTSAITIPGAV